MGEHALEFLNSIEFPLADRLEPTLGELQRFTPTVQALFVPTSTRRWTRRPRRRASGTPSRRWGPGGPSCRRTGPAAAPPRSSRSRSSSASTTPPTGAGSSSRSGGRSPCSLPVIPAVFGFVWLALPLWSLPLRRLFAARWSLSSSPCVLQAPGASPVANFAKLGAMTFVGLGVPALLRGAELGRARRLDRPVRRLVLGLARPDEHDRDQARAGLRRALVHLPRARRGAAGPSSGCPTCSSSRSSSARPPAGGCGPAGRGSAWPPRSARRWRSRPGSRWTACPRCRCFRSASCSRTPTCSGARSGIEAPEIPVEVRRDPRAAGGRGDGDRALADRDRPLTTDAVAGSTTETVSSMFGTQSFPPTHASRAGSRRRSRSPGSPSRPGRPCRSCRPRSRPRASRAEAVIQSACGSAMRWSTRLRCGSIRISWLWP